MRKQWYIFLLAAFILLLLAQLNRHRIPLPGSQAEEPAPTPPPTSTNLLPEVELTKVHTPEQPLQFDQPSHRFDPQNLQKYEGSYTWEELLSGNGTRSFKLHSKWFGGSSNVPQAELIIRERPGSDEYELGGGKIFLPNHGMGISYEKDQQSDETRTFFNVKKEF
jgi:hypothetical protein